MKRSIATLEAHNNAMWCDAGCRAHDRPGELHEALWLTRLGTSRFYPDAVTTAGPQAGPAQLKWIADLIASNRQREWFVKDSFHCLRLDSLGFEPLFDAEWLAMRGARPDVSWPCRLRGRPRKCRLSHMHMPCGSSSMAIRIRYSREH